MGWFVILQIYFPAFGRLILNIVFLIKHKKQTREILFNKKKGGGG